MLQLDMSLSVIAMMKETLKQSQIKDFANFLGLNAIISKLVVGNIAVVKKMKRAYQTYMYMKPKKFVEIGAIFAS